MIFNYLLLLYLDIHHLLMKPLVYLVKVETQDSYVFPFVLFSFSHCVVCSSSLYGLWLPLWYLQTILPWSTCSVSGSCQCMIMQWKIIYWKNMKTS